MKKKLLSVLLSAAMLASTAAVATLGVSAEGTPDYSNFFKAVAVTEVADATEKDGAWQLAAGVKATFTTAPMFGSGFSFLVNAPEGANLTVTLRDSSQSLNGANYYLTFEERVEAADVSRVALDFSEAEEKNTIYPRMNKVTTVLEITSDAEVTVSELSSFQLGALAAAEDEEYLLGDANLDGVVDATDALTVLRHVVGLETFTDEQFRVANLDDRDDEITAVDALYILRLVVGLGIEAN